MVINSIQCFPILGVCSGDVNFSFHYQVNEWGKHGCTLDISSKELNTRGLKEYESQMGFKYLGENK